MTESRLRRSVKLIVLLGSLSLLILLPYLFDPQRGSPWITLLIMANYLAIFAMSWDILSGYTGQISLGHAFFVGAAAYLSGLTNLYLDWPLFYSIPFGVAVSVFLGLFVGIPTLRLRGAYLALVTLILPIIAMKLIDLEQFAPYTRGRLGVSGLEPLIEVELKDFNGDGRINRVDVLRRYALDQRLDYYYSLGLMVAVALGLVRLSRSRVGQVFEAIREDEEAVQAAGINTAKYKLLAFTISAFVAGLGGAFYAHYWGSLVPREMISLDLSIQIVIASVFGGMGTILGPIFGAYFLAAGRDLLAESWPAGWELPPGGTTLVFIALLLLLLRFAPRGVLFWLINPARVSRSLR